ncbi:hypothetical protein J2808_004246 [Pseudarthrobacter sulfonivorans]|nr:hypothetical protein [Pseudarthrobacter sulfonivorans]
MIGRVAVCSEYASIAATPGSLKTNHHSRSLRQTENVLDRARSDAKELTGLHGRVLRAYRSLIRVNWKIGEQHFGKFHRVLKHACYLGDKLSVGFRFVLCDLWSRTQRSKVRPIHAGR